ncbi:MAG: hypothetical protein ACFFBD_20690, partial [Candidatus Hodarchaeota archaeon]
MQLEKGFISGRQLTKEIITKLFDRADEFANQATPPLLSGKRLGMLFFQESVFTRMTFESAMLKMG